MPRVVRFGFVHRYGTTSERRIPAITGRR
jgi:hypothetical protein